MVGQGVLRECLADNSIDRVLSIGRRSIQQTHPKLHELVREDMFDFNVDHATLKEYDACFFCLGVSSAGMNEDHYRRLTFDLTIGWAKTLAQLNSGMTFIYVSGAGTGGKAKWAQVKGRTENALLELFGNAYLFRLAVLRPMHGERSKTDWTRISYSIFKPLLPLVKLLAPAAIITTEELGRAMIRVAQHGASKHVLENRDLIALGNKDEG